MTALAGLVTDKAGTTLAFALMADEEQRARLAEEARAKVAEEARRAAEEQQRIQKLASLAPQASADPCEQDRVTLARVRSTRSLDQVVQFEHDLVCEKLRPQLERLRESLSPDGRAPVLSSTPPPAPAKPAEKPAEKTVVATAPPVAPPTNDRVLELKTPPKPAAAVDQEQACKQDGERLQVIEISGITASVREGMPEFRIEPGV